jgi:hypothetical protein
MNINLHREVAAMRRMSIGELREKYERVFAETTTTRHAPCLIRRIAWRMQANELGGLSERARQRALELADEADLLMTAPKAPAPASESGETVTRPAPAAIRDAEDEPTVGTQLVRRYKGKDIVVTIAENGVRWKGDLYSSLTAVAEAVTGSHWNGKAFFGLTRRAGK